MCKVSVITVTYNAQTCIRSTMRSVLSQRYEDFEYIIKDGNSLDSTNNIIDAIIQSSSRKNIVKHISSKDKGIYDAMNEAVKYASGEWIIFMNAGDEFYDENVLLDTFSVPYRAQSGVLYGHAMLKLTGNRGLIVTYDTSVMQSGGSICHQSVFEKKELLVQHPFDTKLKILSDKNHLLCLMEYGVQFQKINIIVALEDQTGISAVNYPKTYQENNLLAMKYNLANYRRRNIWVGKIKMLVKKIVPQIQESVMIRTVLKRNMKKQPLERSKMFH